MAVVVGLQVVMAGDGTLVVADVAGVGVGVAVLAYSLFASRSLAVHHVVIGITRPCRLALGTVVVPDVAGVCVNVPVLTGLDLA